MVIRLKDNKTEFEALSVIEQKLYRQGAESGWMLSLNIKGDFNAQDLDSVLSEENVSEITLVGEADDNTVISGYQRVTSCVVRYSEDKTQTTAEIQILKGV